MLTVITGLIVNDNNSAERTAAEFFNENFNTYVNIKFSKLEDNWKTYIRLTVAGRRIRLRPRTKVNIREFVQWEREKIRQDEDTSLNLFPISEREDLIERFNTHKQWLEDTENTAKKYIPKNFTENMEWMDWKATLIKLLKYQPGRNGVPLNYVIRDNIIDIVRTKTNFLDDYVDRTPLTVSVFNVDASKVHSYIFRLISKNAVSEQKLIPHKDVADCRVD